MRDLRYLIPRRIPQRLEIVPGVGGAELQVLAAAALLSAVWALVAGWWQVHMLGVLLPGAVLCGAAFFLVRPLPDGTNLWTLALSIHHYLTRPRRHTPGTGRTINAIQANQEEGSVAVWRQNAGNMAGASTSG